MTNSAYIHYTEPNQEPPEHIKAKDRIRHILYNFGYRTITNSKDGHHEYTLPPLITPFIAKTEQERIRQYQIDLLMHSSSNQHLISVEINGEYHFINPKSIAKMRLKKETVTQYLIKRDEIQVKSIKHISKYKYKTFKVVDFRTDEVYGAYALDRRQIVYRIFN